ncbi:MAG: UvrB/UvrC motif-containing protein [Candidatus Vogelbacteria bacterium]|nr:UvrB/UvrC motif-containing protein [Candidatus Vogelbacteria bacterium]
MKNGDLKKYKLPDNPGVYYFLGERTPLRQGYAGRRILYIGKATSLKDRVKSYFAGDLGETRGPKITQMLALANKIDWQETDSVLEALLLETELIKKHQPKYNSREKDDKSYWYVIITDEDFPRVLQNRGSGTFGPFPYGAEMKEALKIIRKIFPYRDKCAPNSGKPCFNRQIGLCPGVCTGEISKTDYRKTVRNIKLFFEGMKKEVIKNLEREMKLSSKKQEFEKAGKVRDQIFALNHIRDVSLLKNKQEVVRSRILGSLEKRLLTTEPHRTASPRSIRIEAYDIAHLSGKATTGAMTVWQDGEMQKSEYKKFRIRGLTQTKRRNSAEIGINDPENLREILERRFNHLEWPWPDIVVVDGNQVQAEVASKVTRGLTSGSLEERPLVTIIAVTKDLKHQASKLIGDSAIIHDYHHAIIEANAEAHRFALSYHRKLRERLV